MSDQLEEPHLLNESEAKAFLISSLMEQVFKSPNKSTMGNYLINEDRVQCHTCFKYQRPGDTFCICGSVLQGITAEVKKQAEQRIIGRFVVYVPGVHKLALKKIQRGRPYGNSAGSQKLKRARDYLGSARKLNYGTIVERYFEDEKYQMRLHERGYTQSDMEEFDCNPMKEEAATP